jgi:hypothetical protein
LGTAPAGAVPKGTNDPRPVERRLDMPTIWIKLLRILEIPIEPM